MSSALPPASATTSAGRRGSCRRGWSRSRGCPSAASGLTRARSPRCRPAGLACPRRPILQRRVPNRLATGFCAASVSRQGSCAPACVLGLGRAAVGDARRVSSPSDHDPVRADRRCCRSCVGAVFAIEASPRRCGTGGPRRSTFVTAPVAPMQAGPSPPTKHGAVRRRGRPRPRTGRRGRRTRGGAGCRALWRRPLTSARAVVVIAAVAPAAADGATPSATRISERAGT